MKDIKAVESRRVAVKLLHASKWQLFFTLAVLVLLTLTVFAQVRHYPFVNLDDHVSVTDNPHVSTGLRWENVVYAFSTPHAGDWTPLTWLSLMLDANMYGSDAGGFHLTNVFWHIANVLLLFAVLRQMTGGTWNSAFVAALFAVHPLHVESVAWISARNDLLATFFGLVTLWAYGRYARQPVATWYVAALIAFVCCLLSKQTLVALPFLLLLLDFWPLRRMTGRFAIENSSLDAGEPNTPSPAYDTPKPICPQQTLGRLLIEKIPFLGLTVVSCVGVVITQQGSGALVWSEQLPLVTGCANAAVAYVFYLQKTFWPAELAIMYPIRGSSISATEQAPAVILLSLVTLVIVASAKRRPGLFIGWLWYLGMLVPTIGFVHVRLHQTADRYSYFPLIGFFISVTWLVGSLVPAGLWRRYVLPGFAVSVVAALTVTARVQTAYWRDNISLFTHALDVVESSSAHYSLAIALSAHGQLSDSILHYRRAISIIPDDAMAHNNLGIALSHQGKFDEAVHHFHRALSIVPDDAMAHYNLGKVLSAHGKSSDSILHYRRAISIDPDYAMAHNNLGNEFLAQGQFAEAIRHYRRAISIVPDYAMAHYNLGSALSDQGQFAEAIRHLRQAVNINPSLWQAHLTVGRLYLRQGNRRLANKHLQRAVQLQSESTAAQELPRTKLDE